MTIGELWVAHPLFPWVMATLGWWVLFGTIVMGRNWTRLRRVERSLQQTIENFGRQQFKTTKDSESLRSEEDRPGELRSGESGIRTEEPEPAAVEEAVEDRESVTVEKSRDKERAGARGT